MYSLGSLIIFPYQTFSDNPDSHCTGLQTDIVVPSKSMTLIFILLEDVSPSKSANSAACGGSSEQASSSRGVVVPSDAKPFIDMEPFIVYSESNNLHMLVSQKLYCIEVL